MQPITFRAAYYVKLGRHGDWEKSSISEGIIRIGWRNQSIADINGGKWERIKKQLVQGNTARGRATRDFNALRLIVESTSDDLWITFHASKLWWCRVGKPKILQDQISKYRALAVRWTCEDIDKQPLIINQISGKLSKLQGFRGTICKVNAADELRRLINNETSPEHQAILDASTALASEVRKGIAHLHWKDFETLVDLLFRNSGWRRTSVIGETMKFADIELEEPVTGELYQVQVKSAATVTDFREYAEQFTDTNFRKLYFVVHSPDRELLTHQSPIGNVELILPDRLAKMVVELGMTNWLLKKIK